MAPAMMYISGVAQQAGPCSQLVTNFTVVKHRLNHRLCSRQATCYACRGMPSDLPLTNVFALQEYLDRNTAAMDLEKGGGGRRGSTEGGGGGKGDM